MFKMADNLQQVLEGYEKERIHVDVKFLNQALVAATLSDNHVCIGKLIKMGAKNIDECIELAKEKDVTKALAMLLLLKVALTGDRSMFYMYTKLTSLPHELSDSMLLQRMPAVRNVVSSREVSTVAPLKLAQMNGHYNVWREILMLTGIDKKSGHVNWSKLDLMTIGVKLLRSLYVWLRKINLSSNLLKSLPEDFKILKQVLCTYITIISLSYNKS